MNMLRHQARELTQEIILGIGDVKEGVDVILAPPFTALDIVGGLIAGSRVMLAAQNVFLGRPGRFYRRDFTCHAYGRRMQVGDCRAL